MSGGYTQPGKGRIEQALSSSSSSSRAHPSTDARRHARARSTRRLTGVPEAWTRERRVAAQPVGGGQAVRRRARSESKGENRPETVREGSTHMAAFPTERPEPPSAPRAGSTSLSPQAATASPDDEDLIPPAQDHRVSGHFNGPLQRLHLRLPNQLPCCRRASFCHLTPIRLSHQSTPHHRVPCRPRGAPVDPAYAGDASCQLSFDCPTSFSSPLAFSPTGSLAPIKQSTSLHEAQQNSSTPKQLVSEYLSLSL